MNKRSAKSKYVRVTPEAAAEAMRTADWEKIRNMTDEDIERLVKDDPDEAGFDPNAPYEVVLPGNISVSTIRHRLHLSQAQFARRIGVSTRLVSDWEQGRQTPTAAARALLIILDELGEVALKALAKHAA